MQTLTLSRLGAALAALGIAASLGGACGGTGGEASTQGASANTTGTPGGSGSGGSGGGGSGGCDPACVAPQVCSSVGNVCIDPGGCAGDGDCEPGKICDLAVETCVPGGGCGSQEAKVEAAPPNVLLVLDRSCSMDAPAAKTKWSIAVAAINQLTMDFEGKIRFGLTMFPDLVPEQCAQDVIPIPVGVDTAQPIRDLLTASLVKMDKYYPDGPCVTNIDTAILQAATEPAFKDVDRDSFVVLISDGKQSAGCGGNAGDMKTVQYITDLYQNDGVPTFVIGFDVDTDSAQMNAFADAGGVPSSGATKFYNAADQASLDAALKVIAVKTLSCTYTLDKVPPNADEIYVFFDNAQEVLKDPTHMNGWDYDKATNQVTFYGPTCEDLKSGAIADIDIVLGCQAPTPN